MSGLSVRPELYLDHCARVCHDNLKFIPAIIDHEEGVSRKISRVNLNRVSAGAIRIHRIGASFRLWGSVAVQARESSSRNCALSVEGRPH